MNPIGQYANDAVLSLITPEDLEVIESAVYEPKLAELVIRRLLPIPSLYPEWAEQIGYRTSTDAGAARLGQAKNSDDWPLVEVGSTPKIQPVHDIILGFTLERGELLAARGLGIPVDATKASTLRRKIAEKENTLGFDGDTDFNMEGLYNLTGRLTPSLPNGGWAALTDGQGYKIVDDLRAVKSALAALDGYEPRALVMHPDRFEDMEKTVSTNYDITAIERVRNLGWFPGGIFVTSTVSNDKILVVDNRPEQIRLIIPSDLQRLPLFELTPTRALVPFVERFAGIQAIFPKSVAVATGAA